MDAVPQISIKVNAKTCQELFDGLLSLPSQAIFPLATDLQDEYGRFNLWTASMAVFAPDEACLDFRLKDVPEASQLFVKQLSVLETRIEQLHEQLDPKYLQTDSQLDSSPPDVDMEPWGLGDIIHSIHETIDWLHRLSNLVRKASVTTQNQKAAAFVLRDEMGTDVTESLRCFYKAIIKRDCKDLSENLVDRLAQTMILRRKRILYRRARQRYWTLKQTDDTRSRLDVLPLPPTEQGQGHSVPQAEEESQYDNDTEPLPNVKKDRKVPSMLTATVVDRDKYLKQAARSRISRATTAPFQPSEKLLVPPRPRVAEKVGEFVCDYCCLILPSAQASDRDRWAKHVKKDLDPYICVFDHCTEPHQLYSSSEEWLAHMSSQHRTRWDCSAKDHPPVSLESREEFIMHMEGVHPGRFRNEQLGFIADSCSRALAPTIPNCPFCSESAGNLDAHVGQHLHYFALQSLPWPEHSMQDAEFSSTYGSDLSSTSEQLDRATLRDTLDDIPSTEFTLEALLAEADFVLNDTPLLVRPVVFPVIERPSTEIDETLEKFKAARRARNLEQPADTGLVDEGIVKNYDHAPDSPIVTIEPALPAPSQIDYSAFLGAIDRQQYVGVNFTGPVSLEDLPTRAQLDTIPPPGQKGKRNPAKDRTETRFVRGMKACFPCRLMRIRCAIIPTSMVCGPCSRKPCPQSVCIRKLLRDMLPSDTVRWGCNIPFRPGCEQFEEGQTRFFVSCSDSADSPCLEVMAASFTFPDQKDQGMPGSRRWGIAPHDHPSEASIYEWMERQILAESTHDFETEMDKLLCQFVHRLLAITPDSQDMSIPTASLSTLLKMRCMWKLWSTAQLYVRERPESRGFLFDRQLTPIKDSLHLLSANVISDLERKMISDCEEYLVSWRSTRHPTSKVKTWLMLWQLMLIYRQSLRLLSQQQPPFHVADTAMNEDRNSFLTVTCELLAALTSIYSNRGCFGKRTLVKDVQDAGSQLFDSDLHETYQRVWKALPSFYEQVEAQPLPTDEVFMAYIVSKEKGYLETQAAQSPSKGLNPVPNLQSRDQQTSLADSSSTNNAGSGKQS